MTGQEVRQVVDGKGKSICCGCTHADVCKYAENQPCVWCQKYMEPENRWHSVSEEMPVESGTYLIATNKQRIVSAAYAAMFNRFNGSAGKSCTHWMKLPDGPWKHGDEINDRGAESF